MKRQPAERTISAIQKLARFHPLAIPIILAAIILAASAVWVQGEIKLHKEKMFCQQGINNFRLALDTAQKNLREVNKPVGTTSKSGAETAEKKIERLEKELEKKNRSLDLKNSEKFIHAETYGYPYEAKNDAIISAFLLDKKTGMAAMVENGERFCEDEVSSAEGYKKILKIVNPNGKEKILYATEKPKHDCHFSNDICCLNLSPDGKYLFFNKTGWESMMPLMVNIETGKYVVGDNSGIYSIGHRTWSENNKNFAMATGASGMAGAGEVAVYVSEYDNPDKIHKAWTVGTVYNTHVTKISFIDKNTVSFSVESREGGESKKTFTYEYDLEEQKLKTVQ